GDSITSASPRRHHRTSAVPVIPPFSGDSLIDVGDCDIGQGEMIAEKTPQEIFDTPTPALYRLFGQAPLLPHVAGKILDKDTVGAGVGRRDLEAVHIEEPANCSLRQVLTTAASVLVAEVFGLSRRPFVDSHP